VRERLHFFLASKPVAGVRKLVQNNALKSLAA